MLSRIQWSRREAAGAPELAGAQLAARPELGLAPAEKDREADRKPYHDDGGSNDTTTAPEGQSVPPAPQTNRKARRCWSPELHRQFVIACTNSMATKVFRNTISSNF